MANVPLTRMVENMCIQEGAHEEAILAVEEAHAAKGISLRRRETLTGWIIGNFVNGNKDRR